MSDIQQPANLADMVRARANSRGDAIAFEFEGRLTTFVSSIETPTALPMR